MTSIEPVNDLNIICECTYLSKSYVIVNHDTAEQAYVSKKLDGLRAPYEHANTFHFRRVLNKDLESKILSEGIRYNEVENIKKATITQ